MQIPQPSQHSPIILVEPFLVSQVLCSKHPHETNPFVGVGQAKAESLNHLGVAVARNNVKQAFQLGNGHRSLPG